MKGLELAKAVEQVLRKPYLQESSVCEFERSPEEELEFLRWASRQIRGCADREATKLVTSASSLKNDPQRRAGIMNIVGPILERHVSRLYNQVTEVKKHLEAVSKSGDTVHDYVRGLDENAKVLANHVDAGKVPSRS